MLFWNYHLHKLRYSVIVLMYDLDICFRGTELSWPLSRLNTCIRVHADAFFGCDMGEVIHRWKFRPGGGVKIFSTSKNEKKPKFLFEFEPKLKYFMSLRMYVHGGAIGFTNVLCFCPIMFPYLTWQAGSWHHMALLPWRKGR